MLTYNFAKTYLYGHYLSNPSGTGALGAAPKAYNGGTGAGISNSSSGKCLSAGISYMSGGRTTINMDIGFSDQSESLDDFKLIDGNYANRKLTVSQVTRNYTYDNECVSISLNANNGGSSDVTVKEMGIYVNFSPSDNVNYYILIARKVLSTPVVIAPGESYIFTYKIKIKS